MTIRPITPPPDANWTEWHAARDQEIREETRAADREHYAAQVAKLEGLLSRHDHAAAALMYNARLVRELAAKLRSSASTTTATARPAPSNGGRHEGA